MDNKQKISTLISSAIENYNQTVENRKIIDAPSTILFGDGSTLDSLGFINFIVAIETEIESELNLTLFIVDEEALSMKENPFRTLASLTNLVEKKVRDLSGV